MNHSARPLLTGRRPLEPLPYQYVNHQLGVSHITAGVAAVGVKWGQCTQNGLHSMWLQPAVLESCQTDLVVSVQGRDCP